MSEIARGDVEILVRAGARSNKLDDARHRFMVEAYLSFEPETRHQIHLLEKTEEHSNSRLREELGHSAQSERESLKSFRPDDEETDYGTSGSRVWLDTQDLDIQAPTQVMDSPILSFNSILHNGDSPVFQGLTVRDLPLSSRQKLPQALSDSWEQPRSVISDSQPDPRGQIDPVSLTRGLVEYLESFKSSLRRHQSTIGLENQNKRALETVVERSPENSLSSFPKCTPKAVQSSSPADPQSSPSPHKKPSSHSERILQTLQNVPSSQDPITPVISAIARSKRRLVDMIEETPLVSRSPPRKIPRSTSFPLVLPSAKPQVQQIQLDRSSSQQEPKSTAQSNRTTEVATSSAASPTSPWANKLIIRASPPTASRSTLTPESLITTHLLKILQTISKDIPFSPTSQTRELRGLERGHWLLDCKAWNDGLRARGWDMLGNFIGRDMAGWGVSCERSEDHGTLRVNCWGVMVRHIYYLLFLASETKIKLGSAEWIGGDGVAIIIMP